MALPNQYNPVPLAKELFNDIGQKVRQGVDYIDQGVGYLAKTDPTLAKAAGIRTIFPQGVLNALYPNDFEYYLIALELLNSNGDTIDYFSFPIMPNEIRTVSVPITNIRRTISSIQVYKNKSFNPVEIAIQGTFGRDFKLLLRGKPLSVAGYSYSTHNGFYKSNSDPKAGGMGNKTAVFSNMVKTGYGCIKVLESMLKKSLVPDVHGKPHVLYLYNPVHGNNWQVEYRSFTHIQDDRHYNVYPGYSMQLTAVADLDDVVSSKTKNRDRARRIGKDYFQKVGSSLVNRLDFRRKIF